MNVICFWLPVKAQILSDSLIIINATFILAAILKWCCPSMFEYFPSWTCKVRCFIISLSFTWFIWLNFWFHFHFLFRIITNFTSISGVLMLSFTLQICILFKLSRVITIFYTFWSPFALNVHFMQFSIGISLFDIKFLAINPKLRLWIIKFIQANCWLSRSVILLDVFVLLILIEILWLLVNVWNNFAFLWTINIDNLSMLICLLIINLSIWLFVFLI